MKFNDWTCEIMIKKCKENPYFNLYLGKLKRPWITYCAQLGRQPGSAIKEAIQAQLLQAANEKNLVPSTANETPFKLTKKKLDQQKKSRMELRFTSTEIEKIKILADRDDCSPQRWLINLIRLTLVKKPQCGMEELQKLGESNYQLLAIGRNLNQIAKHLNQGFFPSELLKEIKQLRKNIQAHTHKVSRTLRANVDRWSID